MSFVTVENVWAVQQCYWIKYHLPWFFSDGVSSRVRTPNLIEFLKKKDMSHSLKGAFSGFLILILAIVSLILFHLSEEKEVGTYL